MDEIRLVLVDDETLILSLLTEYFNNIESVTICCTANSGEEFVDKLSIMNRPPHIVILDLKMKTMSGLEVTSYLVDHHPQINIIVMSSYYKKSFMGFMLKTGVSAFIPKDLSTDKLLEVVYEVMQKGSFFLPEQIDILRKQVSSKVPKLEMKASTRLTKREVEILKLVCLQKTAKEIAGELFLTTRTVEGHKNNILSKTPAKNLAGLVIFAVQNGYVDVDKIPLI